MNRANWIVRDAERTRLPWIQRAANLAERLGDWPVVVVAVFAVGVVTALRLTGQL